MSSLVEEMYHEILLRLPVKSLLKCKCVCKNWYDLISNSDFIKFHLNFTTKKNKPILMIEGSSSNQLNSIRYDLLESSIKDATIEIDYPFKSLHDAIRLWGSCNGLVCIQLVNYGGVGYFFWLWNPATREYKKIPKSPSIKFHSICALGYDHKTDDYMLAIGEALGEDNTSVHVYTLSTNSWKPAQTVPYRFPNYMQRHGVLVNGDLHWLATAQSKFFLLSLDISDQSFKELQLPQNELFEKKRNPSMILGMLEGYLCILVGSYANGDMTHCEVWEMLDYGVGESWTRRYIISDECIIKKPILFLSLLWSFENGKILFMSSGNLVLYDPENGSVRKLNEDYSYTRLAVNYFESLVSVKSGNYVGG